MGGPTLATLDVRMSALEQEVGELRELVDGQEAWSHRKRLHKLEGDDNAARLVATALREWRDLRTSRWTRAREWGAFAVAVAAVVVAFVH